MTPPERQLSQNVAFPIVPALLFQKVVVSYQETRGVRSGFLLLGPPCGQQHLEGCLREGCPNVSKFVKKNRFLSQSRCVAGPRCWSKLLQIEAAALLGPPSGQKPVEGSLRGGGPQCLKICSKNHFLSQSRCVAGPRFWSKLLQIEASSLWGPPCRPETRRR